MTNITLSIEGSVYKKMRQYSEIKWSEFVRKSIKKRLNELETLEKNQKKKAFLQCLLQKRFLKKNGTMTLMKSGTMFDQKDIVLIPFPYSDLTAAKQRPALIISNSILVTSNPAPDGILIKNNSFEQGKLLFKSWIKPHRLFTIHKKIIKKKICSINNNLYDKIITSVNNLIKR